MCYQYSFRCFTTLMVTFRFRCFATLMVTYRFRGFATLKLIMMCYCFRCFATLKVADTCVIACIALQPSRQLIHVLPLSLLCNLHSENVINIVLQCTAFILDNNQHFIASQPCCILLLLMLLLLLLMLLRNLSLHNSCHTK